MFNHPLPQVVLTLHSHSHTAHAAAHAAHAAAHAARAAVGFVVLDVSDHGVGVSIGPLRAFRVSASIFHQIKAIDEPKVTLVLGRERFGESHGGRGDKCICDKQAVTQVVLPKQLDGSTRNICRDTQNPKTVKEFGKITLLSFIPATNGQFHLPDNAHRENGSPFEPV